MTSGRDTPSKPRVSCVSAPCVPLGTIAPSPPAMTHSTALSNQPTATGINETSSPVRLDIARSPLCQTALRWHATRRTSRPHALLGSPYRVFLTLHVADDRDRDRIRRRRRRLGDRRGRWRRGRRRRHHPLDTSLAEIFFSDPA